MQLGPVLVDAKEDSKAGLVQRLSGMGVKAQRVGTLWVDVAWTLDGRWLCFDDKTAEDMIASAEDGRLHSQMRAMQDKDPVLYGFNIEGQWSKDNQTIGYGPHAWSWHRFDNLLLSLQAEGAVIIHTASQSHTAGRIASVYKWSGKDNHGSIHKPKRVSNVSGPYVDEGYRHHVEVVMSLFPGVGEELANRLLMQYPLTHILGITPEGLEVAQDRWLTVRGIGKGRVAGIREFLEQDYSSELMKGERGGVPEMQGLNGGSEK